MKGFELHKDQDVSPNRIKTLYAKEVKELGSKSVLPVIRWRLNICVGYIKAVLMDSSPYLPLEDLGYGLSNDATIEILNEASCFTFDYTPKEGDNLILERGWLFNKRGKRLNREQVYGHTSYIFRKGNWIPDYYLPNSDITKLEYKGLLRFI